MPTFAYTLTSDLEDACSFSGTFDQDGWADGEAWTGHYNGNQDQYGLRIPSVTIPQGATISTVPGETVLNLFTTGKVNADNLRLGVYARTERNPGNLTAADAPFGNLPLTTAYAEIDANVELVEVGSVTPPAAAPAGPTPSGYKTEPKEK